MRLAILLAAAALAAPAKDVTFDNANVLHPAMGAEYRVAGRDVELTFGVVTYHLRNTGAPPVRIATGSVSVEPYFAGDYKVEVKRSGDIEITPQGGSVRVVAAGGTEWVAVGNRMIVRGGGPNPQFRVVSAVSRWSKVAAVLASINFGGGGGGGSSDDSSSSSGSSNSSSGGNSAPGSPTTHAASEAAHSAAASSTAHAAAATSSGGHGK